MIVILLVLIFNREYLIAFSVKNGNQYHNLLKPTKDDVKCITDNTITQKTCGFSGPQFVGSINHETNDLHAVDIRTWQPNWGNALSIYWQVESFMTLDARNGILGWI